MARIGPPTASDYTDCASHVFARISWPENVLVRFPAFFRLFLLHQKSFPMNVVASSLFSAHFHSFVQLLRKN